nr:immunoglobulin light chain junction region [Macaca mulatta]
DYYCQMWDSSGDIF